CDGPRRGTGRHNHWRATSLPPRQGLEPLDVARGAAIRDGDERDLAFVVAERDDVDAFADRREEELAPREHDLVAVAPGRHDVAPAELGGLAFCRPRRV